MSPEQFCYWLQGMLEGNPHLLLDMDHVQVVKNHLSTVFRKVTPDVPKTEFGHVNSCGYSLPRMC